MEIPMSSKENTPWSEFCKLVRSVGGASNCDPELQERWFMRFEAFDAAYVHRMNLAGTGQLVSKERRKRANELLRNAYLDLNEVLYQIVMSKENG
jgi:hypothetical protein